MQVANDTLIIWMVLWQYAASAQSYDIISALRSDRLMVRQIHVERYTPQRVTPNLPMHGCE